MKKILFPIILLCFLIISIDAQATEIKFIYDNDDVGYWGGDVHNASSTAYKDVIGDPYFDVDYMRVATNRTDGGNVWIINLAGDYFKNHSDATVDGGLPYAFGPGDLYISSTGWKATQDSSGHYATDDFSSSEGWDYVVTQGDTGAWGLYTLDYNKITYTYAPTNYVYRENQAWQGGAGTLISSDVDYIYNPDGRSLTFGFKTGDLDWMGAVGFHWTMQCGNDTIEGGISAAPVPEPATMFLLGTGLVGLAGFRRRLGKKE